MHTNHYNLFSQRELTPRPGIRFSVSSYSLFHDDYPLSQYCTSGNSGSLTSSLPLFHPLSG